jgi:predicted nucleic acid-binding protein
MLLDSNIIIYSALARKRISPAAHCREGASGARRQLRRGSRVSPPDGNGATISKLSSLRRGALPLSQPVLDEAVRLRQVKKIKLGDSLVAGTALLHDLTLVTRNVDDFLGIDGLRVLNPFAESGL